MAVKTHALFYKREDGDGENICVQIVHFFCWVQCLGVTFAALYFCTKHNPNTNPNSSFGFSKGGLKAQCNP